MSESIGGRLMSARLYALLVKPRIFNESGRNLTLTFLDQPICPELQSYPQKAPFKISPPSVTGVQPTWNSLGDIPSSLARAQMNRHPNQLPFLALTLSIWSCLV